MPPPSDHPCLHLQLLPKTFYVLQQSTTEALNEEILALLTGNKPGINFLTITRTDEEISIVGECSAETRTDGDWRCIKIKGPMEFGLIGVVCNFTTPLKEAGVPVYAVSTWNTDYILVPKDKVAIAVHALEEDGWIFSEK